MVFIVVMQCAIAASAGAIGTLFEYTTNTKNFIDWTIGLPGTETQQS
jgi:hypothetical protein